MKKSFEKKITREKHLWKNHSWKTSVKKITREKHLWKNHSWNNLLHFTREKKWEKITREKHDKYVKKSLVRFAHSLNSCKINIFLHFRVVYHWFTFARVTFTSWSIMPPSLNQVSFCWALPVYYGYVGKNQTCPDLSELQFWYLLPSSSFVPFWSWCRFMLNLWSLEWDFWLLFWVFLFT